MKATIIGLNLNKGRAIAMTSDGEHVLLELSTDEPELHDEVNGDFDEHPFGDEIIYNITSGTDMDVYIQDYCSETIAYEYIKGL